ncbi:AP2 domain-containing protein [Enterococcus sp. 22-H-5-01]|uniref:AP2 domain-containing protein n=1 Tax=Enterococcus sp. 22-H-5-01 TaxID=3418555 RepID=UPI003D009494
MTKKHDLTGQRFERLIVIEDSGDRTKNGRVLWRCECECGNHKNVSGTNLISGNTKSCGCLKAQLNREKWKNKDISRALRTGRETDTKEGTRISLLTSKMPETNKSGFKGVFWEERRGLWLAYISVKKQRMFLGYFKNKQHAINARKEAEEKYFKPLLEKYKKD